MTQTPKRSAGAAVPRCNPSLRTLLIEYLLADSLLLNPKNPRLHSDKQIRQIANSIKAFGFNVPVLVDAGLQVRQLHRGQNLGRPLCFHVLQRSAPEKVILGILNRLEATNKVDQQDEDEDDAK